MGSARGAPWRTFPSAPRPVRGSMEVPTDFAVGCITCRGSGLWGGLGDGQVEAAGGARGYREDGDRWVGEGVERQRRGQPRRAEGELVRGCVDGEAPVEEPGVARAVAADRPDPPVRQRRV